MYCNQSLKRKSTVKYDRMVTKRNIENFLVTHFDGNINSPESYEERKTLNFSMT